MNINMIKNQEEMNNLMNEFSFFHDYVVLQIKYISGATLSSTGIYPLASERNVIVRLGTYLNEQGKLIELHFKKVSRMNLIPIDERYDCSIIKASLNLIGSEIVFSDCDNFENESSLMIVSEELEVYIDKKLRWYPDGTFKPKY